MRSAITSIVTPAARAENRAQSTSARAADRIPTKKLPKPSAAISDSPMVAGVIAGVACARWPSPTASPSPSREASTTPTDAATIPASWIAAGRSPPAIPTATGTTTPVAEIGATMLMLPTASAR